MLDVEYYFLLKRPFIEGKKSIYTIAAKKDSKLVVAAIFC